MLQVSSRLFITMLLATEDLLRMAIYTIYHNIYTLIQSIAMIPVWCCHRCAQTRHVSSKVTSPPSYSLKPSYACNILMVTFIVAVLVLCFLLWVEDEFTNFDFANLFNFGNWVQTTGESHEDFYRKHTESLMPAISDKTDNYVTTMIEAITHTISEYDSLLNILNYYDINHHNKTNNNLQVTNTEGQEGMGIILTDDIDKIAITSFANKLADAKLLLNKSSLILKHMMLTQYPLEQDILLTLT